MTAFHSFRLCFRVNDRILSAQQTPLARRINPDNLCTLDVALVCQLLRVTVARVTNNRSTG